MQIKHFVYNKKHFSQEIGIIKPKYINCYFTTRFIIMLYVTIVHLEIILKQ